VKFANLGTIGAGAGFSIGAYMADKKPVLYFTGDGSFGFYPMEFDTMAKRGIPVVCVISNDSSWGMIRLSQELMMPEFIKARGGHHSANLLYPMREYENMPSVWGGVGVKVTKIEEIIPAIETVWKSGKPGIVNVEVDPSKYSPRTLSFAGK
jgi:acetolactate synthase-1/2/3 large subunit